MRTSFIPDKVVRSNGILIAILPRLSNRVIPHRAERMFRAGARGDAGASAIPGDAACAIWRREGWPDGAKSLQYRFASGNLFACQVKTMASRRGTGRRKVGRKKRRMRAKIRHRKG
jgi:hypothetical protein